LRKRALGQRPRIEAKVSREDKPDQRWATNLCRVWGGRDGWLSVALVIDCNTRQLPRTSEASTAWAALEQGLITRYGTLGLMREPLLLRSDNGLVFTSRDLHPAGAQLWLEAGVHHPALATAERDGRMRDPDAERAVCVSTSL